MRVSRRVQNRHHLGGMQGRCTACMADGTIGINRPQILGAAVVFFGRLIRVVLMLVMTEVLGCRTSFVLAIHADCRPAELQREQSQQKDEEPTTHG